jgi:phosphoribosyl 1,2-cyclic phosphodiesterase
LIDVGFSAARLDRRLGELGVSPESIAAAVVTHEHRDHSTGVRVASRRWGWPVWMTGGTWAACRGRLSGDEDVRRMRPGSPLDLGTLEVRPFGTCHDAAEPVAVTVRSPTAGHKVGIATDLGRATTGVRAALRGCHFLVLEANHDERMLRTGPYPWSVKRRVGGSRGHLSNRLAGELASDLAHAELGGVLLAHLSAECNDPQSALDAVGEALERSDFRGVLDVAEQDRPSPFYEVAELLAETRVGPQLSLFP